MGVSVKVHIGSEESGDSRSFVLDTEIPAYKISNQKLEFFKERVCAAFPGLKNKAYSVYRKGTGGEYVVIDNDTDLEDALDSLSGNTFSVYVRSVVGAGNDEKNTKTFHSNVMCDGCNGDIYGKRYMCLECPDYDLCQTCRDRGEHKQHRFAGLSFELPLRSQLRHHGVTCDACKCAVYGARYKCIDCPNYDLCGKCKAEGHHQQHRFYCISIQLPDQYKATHPGIMCDGCQSFLRGTRYECLQCPDYDLCERCKTRGIHALHKFRCIPFPARGEERRVTEMQALAGLIQHLML